MGRHLFRVQFDAEISHNRVWEWASPGETAMVRQRLRRGLPRLVVGPRSARLRLDEVKNVRVRFVGDRKKWAAATRAAGKRTTARKRTTRKKK